MIDWFSRRRVLLGWGFVIALTASLAGPGWVLGEPPNVKPKKKKEEKKPEDSAAADSEGKEKFRWGKKKTETDEQYDKRYAALLRKIKFDGPDEKKGGPVRLW